MKNILIAILILVSGACFGQGGSNIEGKFYGSKYGMLGDGVITTCNTTAGSPNITVSSANFTLNSPIGKKFRVQGAGTSNVDQIFTCTGISSSTVAVMSTNAVNSKTASGLDYGTDNTQRLQDLFTIVKNAGGGDIICDRGLFLFFGALQTSVDGINPNAQVVIPLTKVDVHTFTIINLHGQYPPNQLSPIGLTSEIIAPQNCTVFKSEIVGTGVTPSIIGASYYTPGGFTVTYNFTSAHISNILFQTVTSVNNTIVAGTMSCVNLDPLSQGIVDYCGAYTDGTVYAGVTPVNKTYAFIMPHFGNNAVVTLSYCFAWNYNTAFRVSEHAYCPKLTAVCDSIGVEYNNGYFNNTLYNAHASLITDFEVEDCVTPLVAIGNSSLAITSWREERQAPGSWFSIGPYDVEFRSGGSNDSCAIFINQFECEISGSGAVQYDIKTNFPSRLKVAHNNHYDAATTQRTLPYASGVSWDLYQTKKASLSLAGNPTLTINNLSAGDNFELEVIQDATGGRSVTFPSNSVFEAGQALSGTAGYADLLSGYYDGTNILWKIKGNYNTVPASPVTTFLAALSTNGYTPGGTEATGYTTFYNSLVSQGLLSHIYAIYPFAGTTANTHMLNFLNAANTDVAHRITWGGTVVHTSGTIAGDGSTGFGNTHFTPSTDGGTIANAALTTWFTSTTLKGIVGCYQGLLSPAPGFQNLSGFDATNSYYTNPDNSTAYVNTLNASFAIDQCITNSRTASNLMTVYRNGTSIGTSATSIAVATAPAIPVFLLARNGDGAATDFGTNPLIFCVISDGLTSTQATNLYNDLAALKTAMGK